MLWLLVLLVLACVFIYWSVRNVNYWTDQGVPHPKPWPIIGNMAPVVFRRKQYCEQYLAFFNAVPKSRYIGINLFTMPVLVLRDADLIKQITVKNFDHFMDHSTIVPEDVDPMMGKNLFSLKGQDWRNMRSTLSPSFTGSKIRAMFTLLSVCAEQLVKHLQKQKSDVLTLEMKDIFTRFANDAIASVAFGIKVDSLEVKNNEFYTMGKRATTFSGLMILKLFMFNAIPAVAKFLKVRFFKQFVADFFLRIVKETIRQREEEGLIRPDMIHLLMEARKGCLVNDNKDNTDAGFASVEESFTGKAVKYQNLEMSDEDVTAQALIFFLAGFETTASLMSMIAYELAVNPDIQERLQQEVDETLNKCQGKITYEALLGMKYLDAVVSETLRKWPPGLEMERICVKDYTIQPVDSNEKPFTIKKGDKILIPIYAVHRDPNNFPNPDKFDPERFSDENKYNIKPGSYLPFGSGPRSCIASRLALLENKLVFFYILSKFEFTVVDKTVIPIKMDVKSITMVPEGGLWLGLRERK